MKNKKKPSWNIEQAGWGVFGVFFILLAPFSIYFVLTFTYDTVHPVVRVFSALFLAAVIAGVLTALLNSALQWRGRRHREANKKLAAATAAGASKPGSHARKAGKKR